MVMTILVAGCLYHPDHKTFFFSSFDMYLRSSKAERYRMTNGSCTLVFFFVRRNHVEDSNIHAQLFVVLLMILLQTGNDYNENISVRDFGASAEVE